MSDVALPSEYIPRWLKVTALAWPIVVAISTAALAGARADGQLQATTERVTALETTGSPVVRERLARIEQSQENTEKTLERVEKKLDTALGH